MVDGESTDLRIPGLGPAVRIGSGGFADVYRAQQTNLRREVAVKVLRAPASDAQARMRFERECHAMGPLSAHPNIVSVHEGGFTPDGRAYLVMEYFTGGSLQDRLRANGPFAPTEVIEIGQKIGRALGVAHDAGVLHRDVKPANILMSAYGEPALADFGIARVEGAQQTATGQVTASFAHAAPEVLNGESPGPPSDLYSLASTLFELATGAPPHVRPGDESVWAVVNRVMTEAVPDPYRLGLPDPLAEVILRATARHPQQRFHRAAELLEALSAPVRSSAPATLPAPAVTVPRAGSSVAVADPPAGYDSRTSNLDPGGRGQGAGTSSWGIGGVAPSPSGLVDEVGGRPPEPGPRRRGRRRLAASLLGLPLLAGAGYGGWYLWSDQAEPLPPVEWDFAAAVTGPLEGGESYRFTIDGVEPDTDLVLLVDGEDEVSGIGSPPPYVATPGRHTLTVEVTRGDQVDVTDPLEVYVLGDPPEAGFRVNLASAKADPASWPAAIREFDQLVASHPGLELYPSDDLVDPHWRFFVPGFGSDRAAADAYCAAAGLSSDRCYSSEYVPPAE